MAPPIMVDIMAFLLGQEKYRARQAATAAVTAVARRSRFPWRSQPIPFAARCARKNKPY
jgi:hypothetical protein